MAEDAAVTPAPIQGLSHVQLVVDDVPACRRWWATVLGLEPLYENAGTVALRHRGAKLVIVLSPRSPGSPGAGDHLDHIAFAVPDRAALDAWAAHLDTRGIDHPGIVLELGNHSLHLTDPAGTHLELVAPLRG